MTVKELKEQLENLIMEGKGNYPVYVGTALEECEVDINEYEMEVYL